MLMKTVFFNTLVITSLAGCMSLPDRTQEHSVTSIGNETFVTWPAEQGHVYLSKVNGRQLACRAPQSDSSLNRSVGGSLSAGFATGTDGISDTNSETSTNLGGRDPSVLIVREVLFRSCELTMNVNASEEKAEELFYKSLGILENILDTQSTAKAPSSTSSVVKKKE